MAGICLIPLEHLRPKHFPALVGLNSENAAHRVAVLWDDDEGITREGVFIPRRDTNSPVNLLLGGRAFPGEHHRAAFKVRESETRVRLAVYSDDGTVAVEVAGTVAPARPTTSIFPSLPAASAFFEAGAVGYWVTSSARRLDGLTLATDQWRVEPLAVEHVYARSRLRSVRH